MRQLIKWLMAMVVWISATLSKAHSPEISLLTMVEKESGNWTLQLNASLAAYRYEVRNAYGENSYQSIVEFNKLLLQHLQSHLTIKINSEEMPLENGAVKLGHATAVAFEIANIPAAINDLLIINKGFENIHHSRVMCKVVSEEIVGKAHILDKGNNFQVYLAKKEHQLALAEKPEDEKSFTMALLGIITALLFMFWFLRIWIKDKSEYAFSQLKCF
ncbi:MAG: hypothetical protein AAGI25_20105 [Bacteroidota bacterium]